MTQEQYTLYTGQTVNFSSSDWGAIVSVAEMRLASFLCLEALPTVDDNGETTYPADIAMVLANFIAAVLKFRGDGDMVESKHVRNFTINLKSSSASDAFSQIASQYGDIIDKYSDCGIGVKVERSAHRCCINGRF